MDLNSQSASGNPYVGPRAFRFGEMLYSRRRETKELIGLLVGRRIVMLHAPSGAGKTSLIQAALLPQLDPTGSLGFIIPRQNVDGPPILIRVNRPPQDGDSAIIANAPADSPQINRYVLSVLEHVEEHRPPENRRSLSELIASGFGDLDKYLKQEFPETERTGSANSDSGLRFQPLLLVFDQFEEFLTQDTTDREAKFAFMANLGQALADRGRWALFSIRDGYLGALETYIKAIPTHLEARYHLDLLPADRSTDAIVEPAKRLNVDFEPELVAKIISQLRQVKTNTTSVADSSQADTVDGPFIEPVFLQVLCSALWVTKANDNLITLRHLDALKGTCENGVDAALVAYYTEKVIEAARTGETPERRIREWFSEKLITRQNKRSQDSSDNARSFEISIGTIDSLLDAYVIRSETRNGIDWYELVHDRLAKPISDANDTWFNDTLQPFQKRAQIWDANARKSNPDIRDGFQLWRLYDAPKRLSTRDEEYIKGAAVRLRPLIVLMSLALGVTFAVTWLMAERKNTQAEKLKRQHRIVDDLQRWAKKKSSPGPEAAVLYAADAVKLAERLNAEIHKNKRTAAAFSEEDSLVTAVQTLRTTLQRIGGIGLPQVAGLDASPNESPFQPHVAVGAGGRWAAGLTRDGKCVLWELPTKRNTIAHEPPHPLTIPNKNLVFNQLTKSPSGKWLICEATSGSNVTSPTDNTKVLFVWPFGSDTDEPWNHQTKGIECLTFWVEPDVDRLWITRKERSDGMKSNDSVTYFWPLGESEVWLSQSKKLVAEWDDPQKFRSLSDDGRWFAVVAKEGSGYVWDRSRPEAAKREFPSLQIDGDPATIPRNEVFIHNAEFSYDNKRLVMARSDAKARVLYMTETGNFEEKTVPLVPTNDSNEYRTLLTDIHGLWAITYSGNPDKPLCVWDLSVVGRSPGQLETPRLMLKTSSLTDNEPIYTHILQNQWRDGRGFVSNQNDLYISRSLADGGNQGLGFMWFRLRGLPNLREANSAKDVLLYWRIPQLENREAMVPNREIDFKEYGHLNINVSRSGTFCLGVPSQGADANVMKLWDLRGVYDEPLQLQGHDEHVVVVAGGDPETKVVVSGDGNGSFRVWDVENILRTRNGSSAGEMKPGALISPDSRPKRTFEMSMNAEGDLEICELLNSSSNRGQARIFCESQDISNPRFIQEYNEAGEVPWLVTEDTDNRQSVWHIPQLIREFDDATKPFSPSLRRLHPGESIIAAASDRLRIRKKVSTTSQDAQRLPDGNDYLLHANGETIDIDVPKEVGEPLQPASNRWIGRFRDDRVTVWDPFAAIPMSPQIKEVGLITPNQSRLLSTFGDWLILFSPDVGSRVWKLANTAAGSTNGTLLGLPKSEQGVTPFGFADGGQWVVNGQNPKAIYLWKADEHTTEPCKPFILDREELPPHLSTAPWSTRFWRVSRDKKWLVYDTGFKEKGIQVVNLIEGDPTNAGHSVIHDVDYNLDNPVTAAFTDDGRYLAVSGSISIPTKTSPATNNKEKKRALVWIWNLTTVLPKPVATIQGDSVRALAVSNDEQHFLIIDDKSVLDKCVLRLCKNGDNERDSASRVGWDIPLDMAPDSMTTLRFVVCSKAAEGSGSRKKPPIVDTLICDLGDGFVRSYPLEIEGLMRLAKIAVGRNLTQKEWDFLREGDKCKCTFEDLPSFCKDFQNGKSQ